MAGLVFIMCHNQFSFSWVLSTPERNFVPYTRVAYETRVDGLSVSGWLMEKHIPSFCLQLLVVTIAIIYSSYSS